MEEFKPENLGGGGEKLKKSKYSVCKKKNKKPNCEPVRALHSCSQPWRIGEKTAPVQLCTNPSESYHRTILAILNRITDTKMALLIDRASAVILAPTVPADAATSTKITQRIIKKDFMTMLLEKAQDEGIYARVYCTFLCGLCSVMEAEGNAPDNEADVGPALQEVINTECLARFQALYDVLASMYSRVTKFDNSLDETTRRRLRVHLNLIILLHLSGILPVQSFTFVLDIIAAPLEQPEENLMEVQPLFNMASLSLEFLPGLLIQAGHVNVERSDALCDLLQSKMYNYGSRMTFIIMDTLEWRRNGWQHVTPHRFG